MPDFAMRPNPLFIFYDYLLLICASLQWQVFEEENRAAVRLLAGDNVEISRSLDPCSFNQFIPVNNFLHCRSYLDMVKVFVFSYINIFCLGYLVACFYFMLFGGSVLMQPVRYILRLWDWLIGYTCFVIAMKNLLSLGSCAYLDSLLKNGCWLIQAFSMFCTIKGYDILMALLEGLEIYIPQEAEVRSVPLRSLPSSVLRKMGPSKELSDASNCVWICPALFQRKGQKDNPQNQGGARQHMLTVLGNSLGKRSSSAEGSAHWKMSFVTANTTAYKVLKGTLPMDPATQLCSAANVPQGPPSNSEQDAVIIHHGRVYLSVKRKKQELSLSQRPTVVLQRLDMAQGPDRSTEHSQMAPVVHNQLKRKPDTPNATTETARVKLSDSGLRGASPEVSPSQGADVRASRRRGPGQVQRACRGARSSRVSRKSQTATLGASQRAIQIQEADQSHVASQGPGHSHEISLGATQGDGDGDQESSREESGDQSPSQAPSTPQSAPPHNPTQSWGPTAPLTLPDWGPSVPSARQQEFDFQELARRERIAQMEAKLKRSDAGLRSL